MFKEISIRNFKLKKIEKNKTINRTILPYGNSN